jgi:hypothetical protein
MKILSIDPGANTGCAYFSNGNLQSLFTLTPYRIIKFLQQKNYELVILEDSTLISHIYTAPSVKGAAKLKIARNIGEVDGYCKIIVEACHEADIPCLQISPKGKGAKLNAAQFKAATGWEGVTNQHERDAAMVGWPYRNGFKKQ